MLTHMQMLAQIAAWLPALDDAAHTATGLHSPRPTSGAHSGTGAGLPYRLAAILDTTDDGPAGIRTSAGVLDILHPWAVQLSDERSEPARATGHTPQVIGTCPNCGGDITTDPTPSGIPEHGSCERCDRWYQDKEDQAMTRKVALNDVLRNTRNASIYVDWQTLHSAFPTLSHDRLRQWAHRGHVPTQPGPLYQVRAVHDRLDKEQGAA